MLAFYIYAILLFGHILVCQEKQSNSQNQKSSQKNFKKNSKPLSSKDEWPDSFSSSPSTTSSSAPSSAYSIALSNLGNKFSNKSSERSGFGVRITLPAAKTPFYTSSYPEIVPTQWLYTQEGQTKIKVISKEINEVIKGLDKCTNIEANTKDLLALNNFYCWTSEFLNKELEKTKYNIQQVLYDQKTGEFKRATNDSEVDKIKNEVDKFKGLVKKWLSNATEVYNSKSYADLGCSARGYSYSTEWDNKINNNKFNQDLNNFIKLCEDTPNLTQGKRILI